jgi:hypothetical protein
MDPSSVRTLRFRAALAALLLAAPGCFVFNRGSKGNRVGRRQEHAPGDITPIARSKLLEKPRTVHYGTASGVLHAGCAVLLPLLYRAV